MNHSRFGNRRKKVVDLHDFSNALQLARQDYQRANYLESLDIYEQLVTTYPAQSIPLLAEVYEIYQQLPQKDRYNLYQARFFEFGIQPTDKVLDVGSGHLPFPFATHLTDITLENHQYGRAGIPFKHVAGKPVFECTIEHLPFGDQEFDFVYCSHVLEHADNPEKACQELMRVGKRGFIETSTKGKDIFLNTAKLSNHRWAVDYFDQTLVFFEYTPEEIEGLQHGILLQMHLGPETLREKAFSALLYLKANQINTMFFWEQSFNYEVRRISGPSQVVVPAQKFLSSNNLSSMSKLSSSFTTVQSVPSHSPPSNSPSQQNSFLSTDFMQRAQQALIANNFDTALNLLSQAKALKQPTLNLDTLRAMCFLKLNQVGAAWQALLEELRFFPDNQEAKNWLQQIETQVPQLKIGQIQDPEFQDLFKLIRPHTMLSEARLYSLFSLVKRICVENLPGNVVECGVAGGGSTALMALVIKRYSQQPRWLYAFDSFEGLPAPTTIDKHEGAPAESTGWGTGTCAGSEEHLRNLCTQLGVVEVVKPIKGYFQDSLPRMRNWVGMIALLHLDGDWYESTQVILQQFYDRIVNRGILQIDDYGYWEGCRRAVHEFETARSLKFDLKPIDDTGVWCVKPDQFPVNPVLERSLISEFSQDDPMSLGIQSQMSQNERFQLYYAVRKELRISTDKPVRFIEIGSFAGASLLLTCRAFHRITPHFQGFAIEPNRHPQLMQLVPQLKPQVTHLPMLSQQALPQLQQQFEQDGNFPVFIFVDGDHSYEGVWQDAIDYFQLLAPGGLMIFHDCLPALNAENREAILFHHGGQEPGVRRAFEELVECTYGEVVELPLLFPSDPTQTQAYLPIIPGVFSTLRAYRKGME